MAGRAFDAVTRFVDTTEPGQRSTRTSVARAAVRALPARLKISLQYYYHFRRFPNLRQPTLFSEKVQYRKLHDRDPRMGLMIDKVVAKDVVPGIIGPGWVIPTLWSGTEPADIPFDRLIPPYVVKASHAANCNLFVLDSDAVDPARIREQAARWLELRHERYAHEWAYSQVQPGILVEPYIGNGADLPVDLKFLVFHGRLSHIEVCVGRGTADMRWVAFDRNWVWQPILRSGRFDQQDKQLVRPKNLSIMIEAAEMLATSFSFARVDFYEVDDRPLFGEITFYPDAGYSEEYSLEFDLELGKLWRL